MRSSSGRGTAVVVLLALLAATAQATAPRAEEAPQGRQIEWRLSGPGGGGWIEAVAFDPAEPDTVYVGCDVGGFYVSADGGRSFEIRNTGLRDYFVESIAVAPRDRRTILLGTEGGIYRTSDGGRTWQWVREGFPPVQRWSFSAPIGAVVFDPQDPRVAYAGIGRPRWQSGGQGAVYRSEDGGLSWRNTSAGQLPATACVSDVELKPGDGRTVLVATDQGIYRSDDAGKTWRPSGAGLPHAYAQKLAFAPSAPHVVYASLRTMARKGKAWDGGVFRSDDAGLNWQAANGEGMPMRLGAAGQPYEMTSAIQALCVDPRDADTVYAGSTAWVTAGLYKTTDAGETWRCVAQGRGPNMDYGWITQWGPTVTCLALSPADPGRVVFGTSGHLFASADAGGTWQQRYCRQFPDGRFAGNGLEVTCLNTIVPDPVRAARAYYCYMDIGLLITDDEGRSFRRSFEGMRNAGNCFTVLVDPKAPGALWAGTGQWSTNEGEICASRDDGLTWQVVGDRPSGLPNGQVRHLLLDPTSPPGRRRLLATSNGNGVYESRDGGASWRSISANLPPGAVKAPRALLLDPADPSHLLVALAGTAQNGAGVYETRDGGTEWRRLNAESLFVDINALAADPADFRTLYLAAREYYDQATQRLYPGGLFKSADGGVTWGQVLDYHFVGDVLVSPADSRVVYAATTDDPYHDDCAAEGLLRSADGGLTWHRENSSLSLPVVGCIAASPVEPRLLYIGTHGNSAFVGRDGAIAP
jgi:photosystem II stability/assembly factor-like uncharacterized protein